MFIAKLYTLLMEVYGARHPKCLNTEREAHTLTLFCLVQIVFI